MSKTQMLLIALVAIQATDKDGNRIDIAPGKPFAVKDETERNDYIARGWARAPGKGEQGAEESASTADGLPPAPAGYAPGTAPIDNAATLAGPSVSTGDGKDDTGKVADQALDAGKDAAKSGKK